MQTLERPKPDEVQNGLDDTNETLEEFQKEMFRNDSDKTSEQSNEDMQASSIDFSDPIIFDFQEEALEAMDILDLDFLSLETNLNNPPADLINRIFREVHNIKGTAGFFNLINIQKLAHALENVIDEVRNGKFKLNVDFMNVLFNGLDTLKRMITNLEDSQYVEVSELILALNSKSSPKKSPSDLSGENIKEKTDATFWKSIVNSMEQNSKFPDCVEGVQTILKNRSFAINNSVWIAIKSGSSSEKIQATEFFVQTQEHNAIPYLIINSKSSDPAVRLASFKGLVAISIAEVGYTCIHGFDDSDTSVRAYLLEISEQNVSPLISDRLVQTLQKCNFNGKWSGILGEVPIPDIILSLKDNPEYIEKISKIVFAKGTTTMIDDYWKTAKTPVDSEIRSIWEEAKTVQPA